MLHKFFFVKKKLFKIHVNNKLFRTFLTFQNVFTMENRVCRELLKQRILLKSLYIIYVSIPPKKLTNFSYLQLSFNTNLISEQTMYISYRTSANFFFLYFLVNTHCAEKNKYIIPRCRDLV